ncbi:hypothetical protein ASG04_09845 [Curtobacterium sp. Leaf183]|nr:hypothetical protein ASG04_09845 [Curtobacterium sp. Leaf183]
MIERRFLPAPTGRFSGSVGFIGAGVLLTVAIVFLATRAGLQVAVFALLIFGMAAAFNRAVMLGAIVVLVPFIPLLRRLLADGTDSDNDPLAIVLVVAVLVVLLASLRQMFRARGGVRTFNLAALLVLVSVAGTLVATRGASTAGIFSAVAILACLGVASGVSAGVVPDVWPFLERCLPLLGVVSGAYGILQFYVLPGWDRAWMLSSGLRSIGQALPMQVRVFGPSEAPGPYAFILGLCVTIAASRALTTRGKSRVSAVLLVAFLLFPMLLSGVRTAILGVAIALCAILFLRAKGLSRVVPVIFLAGLLFALNYVQGRLAGTSALFSGSRYGQFDAATDNSLQQRLEILALLREPSRFLVGNSSGLRYDNVVVDLLVNFGVVAALGTVLSLMVVAVAALSNLRSGDNDVAAAASVFCLVTAASGNIYLSGFGVLASLAFGSTLASWRRKRARQAHPESSSTEVTANG